MIELDEDIEFGDHVHTVCVPDGDTPEPAEGDLCVVTGWGALGIQNNAVINYINNNNRKGTLLI